MSLIVPTENLSNITKVGIFINNVGYPSLSHFTEETIFTVLHLLYRPKNLQITNNEMKYALKPNFVNFMINLSEAYLLKILNFFVPFVINNSRSVQFKRIIINTIIIF